MRIKIITAVETDWQKENFNLLEPTDTAYLTSESRTYSGEWRLTIFQDALSSAISIEWPADWSEAFNEKDMRGTFPYPEYYSEANQRGDSLSDKEINERLSVASESLRSQQTGAEYWEYGWGAFDSGTMIWSAVQAVQDHGIQDRNTDIVQAAESLVGIADLIFRPLPAFDADSVCKEQDQLQCLAAKEDLLERSAERANDPYEILPHLGNLGFNVLAGLIVWKIGNPHNAIITAVPGEIIGEIQLWTTPQEPKTDFDQYKLQFGPLLERTDHARNPAVGLRMTLNF